MKVEIKMEYMSHDEEFVRKIMSSARRDIRSISYTKDHETIASHYMSAYPWLKIYKEGDPITGGFLYTIESIREGVKHLRCQFRVC